MVLDTVQWYWTLYNGIGNSQWYWKQPMVLEIANGIGNSQWYWKQPMVLEMSDDVDGATVLEFYITVTILIASFR